ncbi:hypothetical protein CEE37_06865 [candidate division LCP-89 bacterium B3_LCP]|uniref:Uncharacterized protein n=1 Tax=candidate division LCP-89 bacterium B3_LCP TaxID=2012998 RepID=A0A532V0H9_UNCL8|nr:MAG: hypothetical protein CEE37_06865 [candidate division LCP-89 bacterium B3_LCP]
MQAGRSNIFILILLLGFFSLSWNQIHDLVHPCSNLTEELPPAATQDQPIETPAEHVENCGKHVCIWTTFITIANQPSVSQIDHTSTLPLIPSDLLPESPDLGGIYRPPRSFTA